MPVAAALTLAFTPLAPVTSAQTGRGVVSVTPDRGEGANYAVGEPISLAYTVPGPGRYRLTATTPAGTQVLTEGTADSTSGTIRTTVGAPAGRQTLRLELSQVDVTFYGETFIEVAGNGGGQPPAALACNGSVKGQLDGEDRWAFTGAAGSRVSATVAIPRILIYPPPPTPSAQVQLVDAAGRVLAEGVDSLPETVLPADGTYTVVVRHAPGTPEGNPDYTLTLNCAR